MKIFFTFLLLSINSLGFAQTKSFFKLNADSTINLPEESALTLSLLPLKCLLKEFPNKTSHISNSNIDHVKLPSELHPCFYGCFDWHSSVHGHWMLIRILKLYPNLPNQKEIRIALNQTLTSDNIINEVKYFDYENTKGWERTYGWAWLLKLDEELMGWNDVDGKNWHENLKPLTEKITNLWIDFIPKQTYPNRTGVHPNTAFGLVFALDYARKSNHKTFEKLITDHALRLYQNDKNAPAIWEPNGSDFFSPSLQEADLMRKILSPEKFSLWRDKFLTNDALAHLSILPIVSDRADLQIVHLDGLSFSRSWCMQSLALTYPKNHPNRKLLFEAHLSHLNSALKEFSAGHYSGDHWLASFALFALTHHR